MAGLQDIPEEVMFQHVFPLLGHNDLLRLRRVCKMTKDFATNYLWSPKEGNQGKWTLEIKPSSDDKNLQAFLQMELPPPTRLFINLSSKQRKLANFFEDTDSTYLDEFIRIYSKYVTHLKITRLDIPFMSAKEIGFYESLVKLEHLSCGQIKTEAPARFQRKLRNEGSCLVPSTFQKLKSFKFDQTFCTPTILSFVGGLKCLETIANSKPKDTYYPFPYKTTTSVVPFLVSLIEDKASKLKIIDWRHFFPSYWNWSRSKLLKLFAFCSEKEIMIKGLCVEFLEVLLCNDKGVVDTTEIFDEVANELVYSVDYQRNSFVGDVIYSLEGIHDIVFLMELPYLEELLIESTEDTRYRIWERHGYPEWPNLRKMDITVDDDHEDSVDLVNFLCGRVERPKLKEFSLRYDLSSFGNLELAPLPDPSSLVSSFRNLKKLKLEDFPGDCPFFVLLWDGLLLLEHVTLWRCRKLGNKGFTGTGISRRRGAGPVFTKLEKLRHLSIGGIHDMPSLTDTVFREVFRHLKLTSLTLSGVRNRDKKPKVSVEGIKALLTGNFAKTIEKLDFEELYVDGLSEDGRRELKSRFRSSEML